MGEYTIREAMPGEAGLVVNFYYHLFEKEFDFLPRTEQYFLHAAEDYFNNPEGNVFYVVEKNGHIYGSICVAKCGEREAQLRMFGTDMALQGKGVGCQLTEMAMNFCREKGYTHLILWTIDICEAARHLYGKFGFVHTEDKPNDTWAKYHMTEELWEYQA